MSESYCLVSDAQIPFEHEKALEFVKYCKRHFKIPDENMYNVGDETDCYWGSAYNKSPNALHSPSTELQAARDKLKQWYSAFPLMKLAISNHGLRWVRKATESEIPSQMLRSYEEIIQSPPGWQWKYEWLIKASKHPFRMIHGMGYSGVNGHRNAAIDAGLSTVIGHLHSFAAISHINTGSMKIWAANAGCLIDTEAYAFEYGKESRAKPCLGLVVVLDGGRMPIWIPL